MKKWVYYLVSLFVLTACLYDVDRPWPVAGDDGTLNGESVIVTFSIPDIRLAPSTKGITDEGVGIISGEPYLDPDKLFLVICGSSQSIKNIRKAKLLLNGDGTPMVDSIPYSDPVLNYPLPEGATLPEGKVAVYSFSVQLDLSDGPRTIHFLGNIDESQLKTGSFSYEVLPLLLSYEGKQAFWQKVVVPEIMPAKDEKGLPIVDPATGSFQPNAVTTQSLQYVPLIRNYAKVKLTNADTTFQLHSYAVIFYPKQGSVVPYRNDIRDLSNPDTGFTFKTGSRFSGYEICSIDDLEGNGTNSFHYPGNLPAGVAFSDTTDIPDTSLFIHPERSHGAVIKYMDDDPDTPEDESDHGFYMYEREIPTTANPNPTYIILCGKYKTEVNNDTLYYYRLDLMETKPDTANRDVIQYYPIYRNFQYDIVLNRFNNTRGVSDPKLAATASRAEDISADLSMRHLPDISNGQSRLVVEPFMAQTYTGPHPNTAEGECYELKVRFYNDAESDVVNKDFDAVQVMLVPIVNEYGDREEDIVILYNNQGRRTERFYPEAQDNEDDKDQDGIRIVRFNLTEATNVTRTQIIKITGKNTDTSVHEMYPLYREVEITLQAKQEMSLAFSDTLLQPVKGTPQTLHITIPTELPQSMFPLDFVIEAEDMTLTPIQGIDYAHNLAVKPGISISETEGKAGKQAFQFRRTLTWNEYTTLRSAGPGLCTFDCFFKSNRNESATTVWVYNEFFNKQHESFKNATELSGYFYVEAYDEACIVRTTKTTYYKCYVKNANGEWTPKNGNSWTKLTNDGVRVEPYERVLFKSNNLKWTQDSFFCRKVTETTNTKKNGKFKIGGNIGSLLLGDNYGDADDLTGYTISNLFNGHTGLIDAYDLVIPMLICQDNCYNSLFKDNTSLLYGPRTLPATKTHTKCYRNMFAGCTNLVYAPVMAEATLSNTQSYTDMFNGCINLKKIVFLSRKYDQAHFAAWVKNVGIIDGTPGEFVTLQGAKIIGETGDDGIPDGWTITTVPSTTSVESYLQDKPSPRP